MKLIIISGRSGSGKSTAINLLEDEGYYAIDNLPTPLIPQLIDLLQNGGMPQVNKVGICVDARNASGELHDFAKSLLESYNDKMDVEIVFLDAEYNSLIKRFSETRRRHPLSNETTSLTEAIDREEKLLEPLERIATIRINTTHMSLHDLRSELKNRLVEDKPIGTTLLFQSFGFKHGIPLQSDLMYDVRVLPNPYWDINLRNFTGRDQAVKNFLSSHVIVDTMFKDICNYLENWLPYYEQNNRSYLTVSVGCTGGQHRSVYLSERLGEYFSKKYNRVQVRHRELGENYD